MMLARKDLLELVGPLYRSLRLMEKQCAEAEGLSMWQYAILAVAARDTQASQAEIAALLAYSKNRIVGDLDALEAMGLAQRQVGADRRANAVRVTPKGQGKLDTIREQIWQREDRLLAHLPEDAKFSLRELLEAASTSARST